MQDLALLPTQVQILSGAIHDMLAGRQDAADILSLSATRLGIADVPAAPDLGPAKMSNAAGVAALQQKVKLLEEQNADLIDELSVSRECLDSTRAELEAAMLLLQSRAPHSAQMAPAVRNQVLLPREEPLPLNAPFQTRSPFENRSTSASLHRQPTVLETLGPHHPRSEAAMAILASGGSSVGHLDPHAISNAFSRWRERAAQKRELQHREKEFQQRTHLSRRSSHLSPSAHSTPKVTQVSTWIEKDAKLREGALSLRSSLPQTPRPEPPSPKVIGVTPFISSVEEMPPDLRATKESNFIGNMLSAPTDYSCTRWRRRNLYTEENWAEWAEWQSQEKAHRDAFQCLQIFSDKSYMLTAPNLRSPDTETQAEAWNGYRTQLIIDIRQALVVGCSWKMILTRLNASWVDPDSGYPRLAQYTKNALADSVLLRHPLLHADLLIFQLDTSYASGSKKYKDDSMTAEWDNTNSRRPGEDPRSLAQRVVQAFLAMHESSGLTEAAIWKNPSHCHVVNTRVQDCLQNDPSRGPDAGLRSSSAFAHIWEEVKQRIEMGEATHEDLRSEHLVMRGVAPRESADRAAGGTHPRHANDDQGAQWSHRTGAGSKQNRAERRAAERMAEERGLHPPTSYMQDSMPNDR